MRQMAIEAGVGESIVNGIIKRGMGARPETLKALADRWGSEGDYRELMRLAGYPVPEASSEDLSDIQRRRLERYKELSEGTRHTIDWLIGVPDVAEPPLSTIQATVQEMTARETWSVFVVALKRVIGSLD
jgi:hypothetical protein